MSCCKSLTFTTTDKKTTHTEDEIIPQWQVQKRTLAALVSYPPSIPGPARSFCHDHPDSITRSHTRIPGI